MRPTIWQSSTSFILKFLNYLQIFVGILILLYSLWMLNDWNRIDSDKASPWFVYLVMGVGGLMCLIGLIGHVAAGIFNGCCVCTYAVFISIFILSEASLMAYLIFDKHWEDDLPHDDTGDLKSLRAFIEANIDMFKWFAVAVVVIQLLSLILAIILRAIIPRRRVDDESDEDFNAVRRPLLNPQGNMASDSTSVSNTPIQSDSWSTRMREKYGLVPGFASNNAAINTQEQLR